MKTIGIDIDGVIYPYYENFKLYMISEFGIHFPQYPKSYKIYDGIMDRTKYIQYHFSFIKYFKLLYKKLDIPYVEVNEIFKILKNNDYNIIIITSRGSSYKNTDFDNNNESIYYKNLEQQITIDWLKEHNLIYNDLIFTENKSLYEFDIFVDDCPDILNKNNSRIILCRNQIYNQNFVENNDYSFRINNLKDIEKWLI